MIPEKRTSFSVDIRVRLKKHFCIEFVLRKGKEEERMCRQMFEKGEYIVYGTRGICKVEDITTMNQRDIPRDKKFYVLVPCNSSESRIFTPVDGQKTVMRHVLGKEEAEQLIQRMPEIEEIWTENEKAREELYKEAIRTCDCGEWVRVIKTLYLRKQQRAAKGKKLTATDERYYREAEKNLYAELAMALSMPEGEVEAYIKKKIG